MSLCELKLKSDHENNNNANLNFQASRGDNKDTKNWSLQHQ